MRMTRPAMRPQCDLIITIVLVSIIFYSISTEAILLGQGPGSQNPPFGPDSPILHAMEGLAEIGTTYTTTSPGTWQRVLRSGSSPYYTTEQHDTLAPTPMEFDMPIQFDDPPEEANPVSPISWDHQYPVVRNQHDPINDNVDSAIMEEPSPVQTIFDDFERQQQDAMMSTTEPSSFEFALTTDPVMDGLFSPPFGGPVERNSSPLPSSLVDYPRSVSRPRLSPDTNDGEIQPSQSQTGSVTQKYLLDQFNLGDRLDTQIGFDRVIDIIDTRFGGEDSQVPSLAHPYPTSIPPEVISVAEAIPPTPVVPSGKKVYYYRCPVHDIHFNRKEQTIEHFQIVHRRTDVTLTNAHPCTHDDCLRSFRHPKDLLKHSPKHTGQKEFACVCTKTYTRSDNLLRHQNGCEAFRRLQLQQHHRA